MFLRKCKVCRCPMDPGEGINGICDDCVAGETERQKRREQMERMVRAVDFTQNGGIT
mgnify:FL=1